MFFVFFNRYSCILIHFKVQEDDSFSPFTSHNVLTFFPLSYPYLHQQIYFCPPLILLSRLLRSHPQMPPAA